MKKIFKILLILIIVLTVLASVFWLTRPKDISFEEHKSTFPYTEFSHFAEVKGVQIHYQEKGEGTPLILLHGLASSTYTWRNLFEPLSKNYRVIAVDLKGFGFSEKPDGDYSRPEQARLVIDLMNSLQIEKAIICGNSMGGEVALNVAIQEPNKVKSLILLDNGGMKVSGGGSLVPFYLQVPYINRLLTALAMTSNKLVRQGLEKSYYDDSKISDETVAKYYLPVTGRDGQRGVLLARQQASNGEIESQLSQINIPTLIVWGADDEVIPLEAGKKTNSLIKDSKLVIYEKCGHLPQEEMPDKLLLEILEFLKRLN